MGFAIINAEGEQVAWSRHDNPPRPLQPGETVVAADDPEQRKPQSQKDREFNEEIDRETEGEVDRQFPLKRQIRALRRAINILSQGHPRQQDIRDELSVFLDIDNVRQDGENRKRPVDAQAPARRPPQ